MGANKFNRSNGPSAGRGGLVSPCMGCENRSVGCHSSCAAYILYFEENARIRDAERKKKLTDYAVLDIKRRGLKRKPKAR